MRLLHTSDWHLGRQFHGTPLLHEQAAAVDRMVEIATEARVDAVVIAGDLYDRAIPPGGAVELLDEALVRLRATGAVVIAVAGNHDSPTRLGFGDRLLSSAGVTLRSRPERTDEPVVVAPADGGSPVAVYPVPFVDPVAVGASTHQQALDRVLEPARADRARRGLRSVVVAHAFVTSAVACDSERDLAVGGSAVVDPGVFAGFDLVTLGHLHGRQSWDGGRVAYSGSPLRYSFSEEHHRKVVRVVELAADGTPAVEDVELGVGLPLRTLTGELEDLLADASLATAEGARVRANLTDRVLPTGAMSRLRARFPHAAELVHVPPAPEDGTAAPRSGHDVGTRRPLDLAEDFLAAQWGRRPAHEEELVLTHALGAVMREDHE